MTTNEPTLYELVEGTSAEKNLAEDFVAVLDKLSALTGGMEGGSWAYAAEKVAAVQRTLGDLERRLAYAADEGADAQRVQQLITAFAQSYGGHVGPKLYPVDRLESAAAREKIAADKAWKAQFRAAMAAGDEAAASELTGGTVRIVQDPDS